MRNEANNTGEPSMAVENVSNNLNAIGELVERYGFETVQHYLDKCAEEREPDIERIEWFLHRETGP